jgi:hypothetical protein
VISTYDGEEVCVVAPGPAGQIRGKTESPRAVYLIGVVGQLDLFAWEIFDKAWRMVTPPRRVVIDLTRTAAVTPVAGQELAKLLREMPSEERAALLIDKEAAPSPENTPWPFPVHPGWTSAIDALGPTAELSPAPITIALRRIDLARPAL